MGLKPAYRQGWGGGGGALNQNFTIAYHGSEYCYFYWLLDGIPGENLCRIFKDLQRSLKIFQDLQTSCKDP